MGKKYNKAASLGRALVKNQQQSHRGRKYAGDNSLLHTTEIQDGYDWGRLNLQSVTEESSFQEFLSTAELAGTEYVAEKLNITFVNPATNIGLLSDAETKRIKEEHEKNKGMLSIPRRPHWNAGTTPEDLQQKERDSFLEWRRKLAVLQEEQELLMTPFEKNLEFWRQLWRVVERSDVVVQIVDARTPLLFRCEDLEKYVKEISEEKQNFILLNKADFLSLAQREIWYEYFRNLGIQVAFFSAVLAAEELTQKPIEEESENDVENSDDDDNDEVEEVIEKLEEVTIIPERAETKILSRLELIDLFRVIHKGRKVTEGVTTIGLVGYPNVGKSSTINTLMTQKKVSVSATPGKTKHFQTLFLDQDLLLCDCPGLVMPSFVFTKAEMITNGILPIDQMRDHVPAVNLVCRLIPRHILEDRYGLLIAKPMEEEENTNRPPTAEELLNAYGYVRGFMTANGQPDNARSARYILKDFVNGKLLYCTAPPGIPQEEFHTFPERGSKSRDDKTLPPRESRAIKPIKVTGNDIDKTFFNSNDQGVHAKGVRGKLAGLPTTGNPGSSGMEKPWKKMNKHQNKKKREKLRRTYAHLDQH